MAVQKEIWKKDIVEAIYAANPHLAFAVNADDLVLAGKVVHIPQAGASPAVKKNRTDFPGVAVRRTDTDVTYSLDEYSSDPVHIQDAETVELSYSKRDSVLKDTKNALGESVGVDILFKWIPAGVSIIRTTGAKYEDIRGAHLPSATGLRRAIKLADIRKAQKQFNKWNIPTEGRYIMLDADMYSQLSDEMSANEQRDFLSGQDIANGVIGKLYTFNFLQRSEVLRLANDAAVDPSADGAATHCAGAIVWHKDMVERALGEVKFFEDVQSALYYGDVYSALVRMGGRSRRSDKKGILVIGQTIVATPAWATTTNYAVGSVVAQGGKNYFCLEAHTAAAAFATDSNKWKEIITED
jgi:hypothetical protein